MADNAINRREFIGKAAAGLVATGLGIHCGTTNETDTPSSEPKIIYRTLGRTQLKIPVVSFGVMNSDSPELIHKALEMGINHLDTAHLYLRGNSERIIGQVLEESGMRDKVYVATKMRFNRDREKNVFLLTGVERQPAATEENFNSQLEESLRRLRTDYVDILYIHSCYSAEMATFEPMMKACVKAKEAGKARFIGVSTHKNEPEIIQAATDTGIYDVVLTAYNYLLDRKNQIKEAMQYAADKGVGIIAMKTQGGVELNREQEINVNHKAALKWVLNDKNVVTTIPGITTFEQLDLDFSVMEDLTLSPEEQRDLKITTMMSGIFYCQNCRTCISSCKQRVEIPTLMRAFMYAEGYKNLIQAHDTIAELPAAKGLQVCSECQTCSAQCRKGIQIKSRVATLQQLFA